MLNLYVKMSTQTLNWGVKDLIRWINIPGTFKPEKNLDTRIEELMDAQPFFPGALAIAVCFIHEGYWATDIMVWAPTMDEPEKVARRIGYVHALCVQDNLLYDAGDYKEVIDTLNQKVVAERDYLISSLCVHDGVMYDGGRTGIFKTDEGKIIAEREGWVRALCSSNGELYDAGAYRKVIRTFDDHVIAEREHWVHALGCYNNILYDATEKCVRKTFENKIIARRKDIPLTLFSFDDKLYDAGQYSYIYETFQRLFKKKLLKTNFEKKHKQNYRGVTAIQPISFWLANQLIRKA